MISTLKGLFVRIKCNRNTRLLWRGILARTVGYPDWRPLIDANRAQWQAKVVASKDGPKVLVATSTGFHFAASTVESLLGVALTLRGANIHFLLCDSALPACFACDSTYYPNTGKFVRKGPQPDMCKQCFAPAARMLKTLGLPIHKYSDYLTPDDYKIADELAAGTSLENIKGYKLGGLAVGEHALAGSLRFFARATLEEVPYGKQVLRRYFKAALLTVYAMKRLLGENSFEAAVFHHGIYIPQGIVGEVMRREGVRVVNWNPAYRKKCFIFSHGDTYHHTLMTEPVDSWEDMEWTPEREDQIMSYLRSRWEGTQDWIWFHERPEFDISSVTQETGVDFKKPCIGMLTNVMWDAQLHYPANAFPGMLDWAVETIRYFADRPEIDLLIRVHPAEIRGTLPSRQPISEEIRKTFPVLPENVHIIPPESSISTYVAMMKCDSVIIYGTKTGVELTSVGVPVIVAGEAWIRNKGITMDATSKEEYFRILDQLPLGRTLDRETVARARKYAYHFFFRRMVPLDMVDIRPARDNLVFRIKTESLSGLEDLKPGRYGGLDTICDGILCGSDFIYRSEILREPREDKVLA